LRPLLLSFLLLASVMLVDLFTPFGISAVLFDRDKLKMF